MSRLRRLARGAHDEEKEALSHLRPLRNSSVCLGGPAGIAAFDRLIERADREGEFTRLKEMQHRYYLRCSECGTRFWIEPSLVKTSIFDGSLQGFRCPEKKCGAVVSWEDKA